MTSPARQTFRSRPPARGPSFVNGRNIARHGRRGKAHGHCANIRYEGGACVAPTHISGVPEPIRPPSLPRRSVLLADCDVFYVQLARLADPDGAGRVPLLIVGGTAESRGVVCSASYEVRAYGVRSAMPISRAVRLCPDAMCVPVPRKMCTQKSREIVRVLQRFAPAVQSASPDEAYLELTTAMGTVYRGRTLDDIAHEVRRAVLDETQIRISLGGGTNRLVAKLAVERAKPRPGTDARGVHIIPPGDEGAFLETCTLAEIPGIGPKFQERLARVGWRDVRDVLPHDRQTLARVAGERQGRWLHDVVRGIDASAVHSRGGSKSISHETTFSRDLSNDDELRKLLLVLSDSAVWDLRAAGYACRTISVRLKDADFVIRRASRTLPSGLTTYQAVAPIAVELLKRLRAARRVPARLVGVSLSQLIHERAGDQLALFGDAPGDIETPAQRRVAAAVDRLRSRLGRDMIGFGPVGMSRDDQD
jgi:DNA polymerase-4